MSTYIIYHFINRGNQGEREAVKPEIQNNGIEE